VIKTETKACTKCGEEKELSEFYSQKVKRKTGEIIYYQSICKECIKKHNKEHYEENYKRLKAQRRRNPTASRNVAKRYRKNHPDKTSAYQIEWQRNNPEKIKGYNERYNKEKLFKIPKKQWEACKKYFNNSCAYCGISEQESIEKYDKRLNKEHAMNNGENNLSNCLPSCTGCNSLKNTYDYIEWYTLENSLFDEDRFNLIVQWLNEDHKEFL
jgi:hypothetical protein